MTIPERNVEDVPAAERVHDGGMRIRPFVDTPRRLIMNSFIPVKKELFTESFNLFPTNEKE